ncbi:MAG: hypothetical protein K2Y32_14600 [Candidatus Obscuribacterales bacterium]|nr:hypothetical protein [Candidatus Obscuribacterales bacterium]
MYSFSPASVKPNLEIVKPPLSEQSQTVDRLEQLLGKIFNDEIEHAISREQAASRPEISVPSNSLLDFSVESFFIEETNEKVSEESYEWKSIIEADDIPDYKHEISALNDVIASQRRELITLRNVVKITNDEIRLLKLDLADKTDEIAALPELIKAPLLEELEMEKVAHQATASHLIESQNKVSVLEKTFWYRLGKFLGLC